MHPGASKWLTSLRESPSRSEVQKELTELMGVGRKVADCIALFSLDKLDIIPVDTHVWQIAQVRTAGEDRRDEGNWCTREKTKNRR